MNFLSDPISRTSGHPTTRHTDTRWSHIVIHGRGGPSATESAAGAALEITSWILEEPRAVGREVQLSDGFRPRDSRCFDSLPRLPYI